MIWQCKWILCYLVCFPPLAASLEVRAGQDRRARRSFDVLILGSGAGGLFAAGAAQMLGQKTALLDRNDNIGGDCTNSACVPSKALRSAASQGMSLPLAREYMSDTVNLVLQREDPEGAEERNPNLDTKLTIRALRDMASTQIAARKIQRFIREAMRETNIEWRNSQYCMFVLTRPFW
jgi:phytoene dehydrogenase-like protein